MIWRLKFNFASKRFIANLAHFSFHNKPANQAYTLPLRSLTKTPLFLPFFLVFVCLFFCLFVFVCFFFPLLYFFNAFLSFSFFLSKLFTFTLHTGTSQMSTTLLEERLGSTRKRPSYEPIGTRPSTRFVSE